MIEREITHQQLLNPIQTFIFLKRPYHRQNRLQFVVNKAPCIFESLIAKKKSLCTDNQAHVGTVNEILYANSAVYNFSHLTCSK